MNSKFNKLKTRRKNNNEIFSGATVLIYKDGTKEFVDASRNLSSRRKHVYSRKSKWNCLRLSLFTLALLAWWKILLRSNASNNLRYHKYGVLCKHLKRLFILLIILHWSNRLRTNNPCAIALKLMVLYTHGFIIDSLNKKGLTRYMINVFQMQLRMSWGFIRIS